MNVKIGNEIVSIWKLARVLLLALWVSITFNNLKIYDYSIRRTDDTVRSVIIGTEKLHSIITVPVTVHGERYR